MFKMYTSYRCNVCKNEFVLLTDQLIEQQKKGRYIACPFCNSQKINKQKVENILKECMKERSYKRVKGALRQR